MTTSTPGRYVRWWRRQPRTALILQRRKYSCGTCSPLCHISSDKQQLCRHYAYKHFRDVLYVQAAIFFLRFAFVFCENATITLQHPRAIPSRRRRRSEHSAPATFAMSAEIDATKGELMEKMDDRVGAQSSVVVPQVEATIDFSANLQITDLPSKLVPPPSSIK